MLTKQSAAHKAAQTVRGASDEAFTQMSSTLALVRAGHLVRLVFQKYAPVTVLLELEDFEKQGIISFTEKCRSVISLLLANNEWSDDSQVARTFMFTAGPSFSFETFRQALKVELFEEIVDLH